MGTELFEGRFVVAASLPRNDMRLARAAAQGGADVLKVHINVEHRASGVRFGRWEDERERIEAIMAEAGVPVGLMPGASASRILADLPAVAERPFAFLDAYVDHLPASLLWASAIPLMPALGVGQGGAEAAALAAFPGVACIEASVIRPEAYGEPLTVRDLLAYREIAARTSLPVIVPSQKRIVPEDVPALIEAGCRGVLLGAVVFGSDADRLKEAVRRFKEAAESAWPAR